MYTIMVYTKDTMKMVKVVFTRMAEKQICKIPNEILEVIQRWVLTVEETGIENTRKQGGKGLHDEPLSGELKGLWSAVVS
jgi:mRNA-degrading endonuclease RelE of RelBE toxin-antitoxin system